MTDVVPDQVPDQQQGEQHTDARQHQIQQESVVSEQAGQTIPDQVDQLMKDDGGQAASHADGQGQDEKLVLFR